MVSLIEWLRSLDADRLGRLLRVRSDLVGRPEPRTLDDLATRMSTRHSVASAAMKLDRPALQLLEILRAMGDEVPRAELDRFVGVGERVDGVAFAAALDRVVSLGLVWPDCGMLRLAEPLRRLRLGPLALGPPIEQRLLEQPTGLLHSIGHAHGISDLGRRREWVDALVAALSDPDRVAAVLAEQPQLVQQVAHVAASERAILQSAYRMPLFLPPDDVASPHDPVGILHALGLLYPFTEETYLMPQEVALAVRGQDYRPPFDSTPPPLLAVNAAERTADTARGSAAAAAALDSMRRLLSLVERAPIGTLQGGGVGIKELRRTGKELGADEAGVRLWLEIAAGAGLLAINGDSVSLTAAADGWLSDSPGPALAGLLSAWWQRPKVPGELLDDDGRSRPALWYHPPSIDGVPLRRELLGLLAGLDGAAPADRDALHGALLWRLPLALDGREHLADTTLEEAERLGLVERGGLTPLGAGLLAAAAGGPERHDRLVEIAADLVPPPSRTAVFLPDLTAMVSGAASAELSALLDGAADAESRDAASIWRFSPDSVRRALDAGRTAAGLIDDLTAVAERPLPQGLDYLVRDAARRHGELEVVELACALRIGNAALVEQVLGDRKLRRLRLFVLADTMLGSVKTATETVTALRAAGYAPVRRDGSGELVVEAAPHRRAPTPRRWAGSMPVGGAADDLARKLLTAPGPRLLAPDPAEPAEAAPAEVAKPARSTPSRPRSRVRIEPDLRPEKFPGVPHLTVVRGPAEPDNATRRATAAERAKASKEAKAADQAEASALDRTAIERFARQLTDDEREILRDALAGGTAVRIGYVSASGSHTTRVIDPLEVEGALLDAWCHLRDDERQFALGRITEVEIVS